MPELISNDERAEVMERKPPLGKSSRSRHMNKSDKNRFGMPLFYVERVAGIAVIH